MAKTIRTKVYKFEELSTAAKETAINQHIQFEIEFMNEDSPYWNECLEMERMQTPWFLPSVIYERHKDSIVETIKANDYMFFHNGRIYHNM